jgi:hypothetical protein
MKTKHDSLESRPVLEAAVRLIWGQVNVVDALYHPNDRGKAYHLLVALYRSGYTLDTAYIESWAAANGWTAEGAAALADVARAVNAGKRLRRIGDASPISVSYLDHVRWFAWGVQMDRKVLVNAHKHRLGTRFVLEAVLMLIQNQVYVNDALYHPSDKGRAYRLFQALRDAEKIQRQPAVSRLDYCCLDDVRRRDYALDPTYIERWAKANGWSSKGAAKLREIAQEARNGKTLRGIGGVGRIGRSCMEWFVLGVQKDREVMENVRLPSTPDGC